LTIPSIVEVYDKYYKFTTKTNERYYNKW
jgi:hypothetical protein